MTEKQASQFMRWLKEQIPTYNEQMKDAATKAWCAAVKAERERMLGIVDDVIGEWERNKFPASLAPIAAAIRGRATDSPRQPSVIDNPRRIE